MPWKSVSHATHQSFSAAAMHISKRCFLYVILTTSGWVRWGFTLVFFHVVIHASTVACIRLSLSCEQAATSTLVRRGSVHTLHTAAAKVSLACMAMHNSLTATHTCTDKHCTKVTDWCVVLFTIHSHHSIPSDTILANNRGMKMSSCSILHCHGRVLHTTDCAHLHRHACVNGAVAQLQQHPHAECVSSQHQLHHLQQGWGLDRPWLRIPGTAAGVGVAQRELHPEATGTLPRHFHRFILS